MLTNLDNLTNEIAVNIESPVLTSFSKFINFIFDPIALIIILLGISIYLFFYSSRKKGIILAGTAIATAAVVTILKNIIQRARPENAIIESSGFSFPSGHSTLILVFLGSLIYLFAKGKTRKNTIIISIPIILIVGLTRVYLRIHFLTDIIAGIAIGSLIIWGMIIWPSSSDPQVLPPSTVTDSDATRV